MVTEGVSVEHAMEWVLRRLPASLRQFYRMQIAGELIRAGWV
jgi:hypothetical protein